MTDEILRQSIKTDAQSSRVTPRRLSIGILLIGLISIAYVCYSKIDLLYNINRYRGEGVITDSGFFSYPRYRIIFPTLSLHGSPKKRYVVIDGPPTDLAVFLKVKHLGRDLTISDEKLIADLKDLPIELRCKLTDDTGLALCNVKLPIRLWEFNKSVRSVELWDAACCNLELHPKRTYNLDIEITSLPKAVEYSLEPRMEGGGNELP